jgi:hypothetical protein
MQDNAKQCAAAVQDMQDNAEQCAATVQSSAFPNSMPVPIYDIMVFFNYGYLIEDDAV